MDENLIFDVTRQALWIAVRMSAPLLAVALVTGVVIGLFQALTSVQEMTLTFVPKVGLMLAVFWVTMSFMTSTLAGFFADQILPLVAGG
ncbi:MULTISPECIES: flagellar biosynthetic protein FliQ [unclassified Paracoccus (in: a-proteobacteria)]|uniref:flagellar biosynthetic protein FliQ n=1 Tax=unclassified Paracoccus (in: a-proteobacteria) TaxID=2688777 RepID=UPI0016001496|nr:MULTISPECIES: flagellar biosynthetic protein FliQ [unclassified Paracoccus (in: a-proteobacteria)]MBB1490788.1 flagellar biosynthetic protein FliQ [Paracoccus sp. MC1854]MBB1497369.1 flagellar biosynthetic protein FliQ [Paracoccus sp. MC1862]MDO5371066.1 flagellar biosynthetic protein FliQ [Paracoccus sp. (in: a-proteobacteria)]QQO45862.1 flagellar biosynthetic protein FliQ [Paracoccus sp. MC1862]